MTEIELTQQKLANQERTFKLADFLSKSSIIPKHFQGSPANVFIALEISTRLNVDFFELVNGLYVVHGSPGFSGVFIIGRINASGKFKTKLNFKTEGTGDKMSVTAYATDIDGIDCSATVSMEMAKSEGWTKNTKYKTMPEQMLIYRSSTFFCRRHCPEVLMGSKSIDEIEDIHVSKLPIKTIDVPQVPVPNPPKEEKLVVSDLAVELLEKTMTEAMNLGIAKTTLQRINPDLSNPEQVEWAQDRLDTMISDAKELLK